MNKGSVAQTSGVDKFISTRIHFQQKDVQGNALVNRDDVPVRALGRFTTLSERAVATSVLPQLWQ